MQGPRLEVAVSQWHRCLLPSREAGPHIHLLHRHLLSPLSSLQHFFGQVLRQEKE